VGDGAQDREQHAGRAEVQQCVDGEQMASHLPDGGRLHAWIHEAVPDDVDGVAEELQGQRGPDPETI